MAIACFPILVKRLPWSLTWNRKISPWKLRFLLDTINLRFHVKLWGCIIPKNPWNVTIPKGNDSSLPTIQPSFFRGKLAVKLQGCVPSLKIYMTFPALKIDPWKPQEIPNLETTILPGVNSRFWTSRQYLGLWFQIFLIFTPTWWNDPIWLIFFKWVETTT